MVAPRKRYLTNTQAMLALTLISVLASAGFGIYWDGKIAGGEGTPILLVFLAWWVAWTGMPKTRRHRPRPEGKIGTDSPTT